MNTLIKTSLGGPFLRSAFILIALVAGLGLMPGWELTSAAQTCQQEGAWRCRAG